MPHKADMAKARKWILDAVDERVQKHLSELGVPRLMTYGVIKSITVAGTKNALSVADVYINGSTTAATNVPVNPDIAPSLSVNDPVWVMNVNFNSADMYVIARHNGIPTVSGVAGNVTDSSGNTIIGGSGVLSELLFVSSGQNQGWQNCGWFDYSSNVNTMALLFVYIPSNFTVQSATLYSKHLPYYENDTIQKWWYLTNGQLMFGADADNAFYNGVTDSYVEVNNMTDITSSTWGSYWNPTGTTVQIKSCDVTSHLTPGQRVAFGVNSHDSASTTGGQLSGMMQFELVVTGYKSS